MNDYEKLKKLISEIDDLIAASVKPNTPIFQAWYLSAERFLIKRFGQGSYEHDQFKKTRFSPGVYVTDFEVVRKCKEGLEATRFIFEAYLEEMKNDLPINSSSDAHEENTTINTSEQRPAFDKVFIVHGHDGALKQSVARIIEKQGIDAIILSEQVNQGRTIIEKFESYSDVSGAICLFTTDDFGREKSEDKEKPRARQNVVLETGYFWGKLGRDHIVILSDNGIEMPSDLSGVVYTNTSNWQIDLLKELKAMGYNIDFNKLF